MLLMVLPLLVGIFLIIALFNSKAEVASTPAQFEVIREIPYCVTEGILYRYEDTDWIYAGYSEPIKQLIAGDTLCAVDADGNVIFEGDLTFSEDMSLTSGYFVETAQNFIDLNQTIPFVEISGDIMFGPRALLEDGSILLPIGTRYEQYTMDETPVALSDDFILTEKGNVYQLSVVNYGEPDLCCVYDGGDITAISALGNTGQCLGITKSGGVISWNTSGNMNFNIPSVSSWTDVIMVKQGFHFALALTKTGEVLYADCNKDNTEKNGNKLDTWRDITNVSISGMTVYGLKSDGSYLSMKIEF